ncbi:MAG: hypothetical protein ACKV2Q_27870 [Planctomycetaceae bacterium]
MSVPLGSVSSNGSSTVILLGVVCALQSRIWELANLLVPRGSLPVMRGGSLS